MANFVLFSWPVIAIAIFGFFGRERGVIWSVVIGYLFLPEVVTIPLSGLPDYNKQLAISLGVVLGAALYHQKASFPVKLVLPPPRDLPGEIEQIWKDRLGLETVSRDQSFAQLGGTGALTRVTVRDMIKIGVDAKIARKLYDGATIRDLVKVLPLDGPRRLGAPGLTVISYTLIGLLVFATVMTMLTNGDALVAPLSVRPGLSIRDVISLTAEPVIVMVPFIFALNYLRGRSAQMEVGKAIVLIGVFYAGLAAFEARMSPQLNVWVYGFFQHSWAQHLRDGFRPIVFLSHGLTVGFFLLMCVMMAFAMFRHTADKSRLLYLLAALWVLAVLAISRNLGALILGMVFIPLALLLPRYIQIRLTVLITGFFLVYPAVWQAQILPVERFTEVIAVISEDRASSFAFRFQNEAEILARAAERPIWGWGGWDRWRVFDDQGRDTTIADGIWIITLGERGWVGYVCFFLILTLPIFFLTRAARRKEPSHIIPIMALIMAANLLYMIPNSTLTPLTWLIMGTIAAHVRWHLLETDPDEQAEIEKRRSSPYTRFADRNQVRPYSRNA
ncbi:MAG: hypothetical protein AAFX45_12310 [Pseudomonadota bacterium]